MKEYYFFFDDRQYVVKGKEIKSEVEELKIKITWLYNNKPKLLLTLEGGMHTSLDYLQNLTSDLLRIESVLISTGYKHE